MWRRMWVKALRMFCQDQGPRMADRMLANAILVRRQRDGLAVGFDGPAAGFGASAGGVVGSTGGRVRELPGVLFGDQEDDQPGVDPGLRELRFLSRQLIEPGQAFHALEGQFELPAEAI